MFGSTDKIQPAPFEGDVTVRMAVEGDAVELLRLAALDSAQPPAGPTVVAEVDDELVAALPVDGGRAIADPFHRTAAVVQMLELRAGQLRATIGSSAPGISRGLPRALRPAQ